MKKITKISSKSGKTFIEILKDDNTYVVQNQNGSILTRIPHQDEDAARSLMETLNVLTTDYGWSEKRI
jgi:hypothetical protein